MVLLTIKGHRDLLVALADGGGFKLGDALLEIGAAIAAKIGGFDRPVNERADEYSGCGSSKHAVTQNSVPQAYCSPPVICSGPLRPFPCKTLPIGS